MKTMVILIILSLLLILLIQLMENNDIPLPIFSGASGKPRNNEKALLTEQAVLIRKTAETAADEDGVEYTNLLLEFDTGGSVLPCYVTGRVYRRVQEGMQGLLTHRGTVFKSFEVDGMRIEK